jgi:hypothetical protein
LYFGSSGNNRFDAPNQEYGVLYVSRDVFGAFIETFGHATGSNVVTMAELLRRGLARIEAGRPLRLVDLTGPGLARLSADGRLSTGDLDIAQRWSLALYNHPDQPDGICYRARHDPSRLAAALFERPDTAFQTVPLGSLAAPRNRRRLRRLLDTYQFGLL